MNYKQINSLNNNFCVGNTLKSLKQLEYGKGLSFRSQLCAILPNSLSDMQVSMRFFVIGPL